MTRIPVRPHTRQAPDPFKAERDRMTELLQNFVVGKELASELEAKLPDLARADLDRI